MPERDRTWVFKYSDGRETGRRWWGWFKDGHLRSASAVTQSAQGVKWDREPAETSVHLPKDKMASGGWRKLRRYLFCGHLSGAPGREAILCGLVLSSDTCSVRWPHLFTPMLSLPLCFRIFFSSGLLGPRQRSWESQFPGLRDGVHGHPVGT